VVELAAWANLGFGAVREELEVTPLFAGLSAAEARHAEFGHSLLVGDPQVHAIGSFGASAGFSGAFGTSHVRPAPAAAAIATFHQSSVLIPSGLSTV
jgi:hypothetical protein